MEKICVFPGTFDPFTLGHLDIVIRAADIFDKIIVAVSENESKSCLFSLEQRKIFAQKALENIKNAEVKVFSKLLVDFCADNNASVIIRGLRTVSDLEYENALGVVYRTQNPKLETIYLINSQNNYHIRGTIVRELLKYRASINEFVPSAIVDMVNYAYKLNAEAK